jgi:hypothetical protein
VNHALTRNLRRAADATRRSRRRTRRHPGRLFSRRFAVTALACVALSTWATAAYAADPTPAGPSSLVAVIDNIRGWLFGLLVAVATLFLTVGGVRLMWANGDPGEAEKGKAALKNAAVGYALALLAPLIVTIVASWVQ